MWRRFAHRLAITPEGRIPPMVAESASPAWRPLSKAAALARTGRNGREAAERECGSLAGVVRTMGVVGGLHRPKRRERC